MNSYTISEARVELLAIQAEINNAGDKTQEELLELRNKRKELSEELGAMLEVERLTTVVPVVAEVSKVTKSTKPVFQDIDEALAQFEVVVKSCSLDLDLEWERLLPLCLAKDLRDWLKEFYEANQRVSLTWMVLKKAMLLRYAEPKEQARFTRLRRFLSCGRRPKESIDAFFKRFKDLKNRSEITDKHVVALVFLDSFSPADARLMMGTMAQADESALYDLEYMCAFARRLDIAVGQEATKKAVSSSDFAQCVKNVNSVVEHYLMSI
ncbi:hypothetical protein MBANPS3_012198 [Mucor bainieri]